MAKYAGSGLDHALALFERGKRDRQVVGIVHDYCQTPGATADSRDFVEFHHRRGRVDGIHHIVEPAGQRVNVFTIQGRDEGAVEVLDDAVGGAIAAMLDVLDGLHLAHVGGVA